MLPHTGFFQLEKTEKDKDRFHCPCNLSSTCKTRMMSVFGKGRSKILIVGDAPGEDDDRVGRPFVGRSGKLLKDTLALMDIYIDKDCWRMNAVNCRPPHDRSPTDQEILGCRENVFRVIREKKPRVIILLGGDAIKSILKPQWKKVTAEVGKFRGYQIPCPDLGAYICPTYHPNFVFQDVHRQSNAELFFRQDLKDAIKKTILPAPEALKIVVEQFRKPHQAGEALKYIIERWKGPVAFDYETTGLKPHAKGHRVVCMSVSNGQIT